MSSRKTPTKDSGLVSLASRRAPRVRVYVIDWTRMTLLITLYPGIAIAYVYASMVGDVSYSIPCLSHILIMMMSFLNVWLVR